MSLRSETLESRASGQRSAAPGAGSSPRKSGSLLYFLSLRSKPLERVADLRF